MEKLTQAYPHILFESCSGGGGRYDAGMLYYMPQTWTSDNTDAVCRLKIQHGTSFLFPTVTMGAHVSACPNHQVGRTTPLATRFAVAAAGNLGYELDLKKLLKEEKKEGPTCRPMQNTKRIKPNSLIKCKIWLSPVKPKCPINIPVKRTKVTPSEIPKILIFPSSTPTEITNAYKHTMWATEEGSHSKVSSQSIVYLYIYLDLLLKSHAKLAIH